MSVLRTVFRTELLLLLRNKFIVLPLIINLLGWGYIIISYEIQELHFRERAAAFYSGFIWMIMLNLLIIGLLAVYMAGKDRESEFEQLVATYQVKNVEWIMGKWFVTQLYGLSITFITILIQAGWFVSGKMAVGELAKNVLYVLVQMEGALFLLISLGFLFGILLKNMFAYLAIPAALVLSLGLPFENYGVAYSFDNPRFHLLTPFDYMFIESPYEGIWGIDRVFGGTILHQVIVLFLGIILILLTLLLFRSNRRIQKEKKVVPILIIIFMIPTLLLGGIRYGQYNQALEQFITTGQQYTKKFEGEEEDYWKWENSYYDAYLDHTKYEFSMERTDLAVQLQPDNQIDVKSYLTIKHNGDEPTKEVYLTLYHELEVSECSSKSEVTCSREGDLVTVQLEELIEPGEAFELSLNYHGNILQYRDDGYVEHSFIQNNRVYLPKEAGWYPLIGERQLVIAHEHGKLFAKFEQRNGRLVEDFPTEFAVEINNENNKIPLALSIPNVEADLYQGTTQYGLSLVGGNVKETEVGEVRVVGHPEVLKGAKEKVKQFQKGWDFIEDWLGESMEPSVIYILNDRHGYLTSNTPSQEFQVWDYGKLTHTDDAEAFAYDLWNSLEGDYPLPHESTTDDQNYLSQQAYGYLREAAIWVILNQFYEVVSFKDWSLGRGFPPDEDEVKLINLLHGFAEKSDEEFEAVVKYLLIYFDQLEDKNEFNLEDALEIYEVESSL